MTDATITVIGDALLDRDIVGAVERVCPDAPAPVLDVDREDVRPGGAALAACLLARDGVDVELITAIGDDAAGRVLRQLIARDGVRLVAAALGGATPEKVRVRAAGQSIVRLDRASRPSPIGAVDRNAVAASIAAAGAVLVSDYGRGLAAHVRPFLERLPAGTPLVWDPHPRGSDPPPGAHLVTPNDAEARLFAGMQPLHGGPGGDDAGIAAVATCAHTLVARWQAQAVAITLGGRGALVARTGGGCVAVPAPAVLVRDTCGAGDRFAGAAARALAGGAIVPEAVASAVIAASEFVGRRATPPSTVEQVRARGGTVVATAGCFDLLHAGHVAMLHAARQLGDCLVVLLNSDASVRRLKGDHRPIQPEADRRAVLQALASVDDVVVFDDDTPVAALHGLRPHVYVKGGDYSVDAIPETAVVERWGGRTVIVPYLDGRSTTRIVEEVTSRAHR